MTKARQKSPGRNQRCILISGPCSLLALSVAYLENDCYYMLSYQVSRTDTALLRELDLGEPISAGSQAYGEHIVSPRSSGAIWSVFLLVSYSCLCLKKDNISVYKKFTSKTNLNSTAQGHKLQKQF